LKYNACRCGLLKKDASPPFVNSRQDRHNASTNGKEIKANEKTSLFQDGKGFIISAGVVFAVAIDELLADGEWVVVERKFSEPNFRAKNFIVSSNTLSLPQVHLSQKSSGLMNKPSKDQSQTLTRLREFALDPIVRWCQRS
jgi:hypothetical protein